MIIISEIREQVKKKKMKSGLRYFHVLGKTEVLYHSVICLDFQKIYKKMTFTKSEYRWFSKGVREPK